MIDFFAQPQAPRDPYPRASDVVERNDFHGALAWVHGYLAVHEGRNPPGDQLAVLLRSQDDPQHLIEALRGVLNKS